MAKKEHIETESTMELLNHIHDLIVMNLQAVKLTLDESRVIAVDIVESIASNFGGDVIYIPKCTIDKSEKMHQEIYDLWKNGESVKDIRNAYGISLVWTYAIIKRIKEKRMNKIPARNELPDI